VAVAWLRFGNSASPAQKSTGNRKTCGIKATAGRPQRQTGLQALELLSVFDDTGINGIVAFLAQGWRRERRTSIGSA
jgi:hypothetical protein